MLELAFVSIETASFRVISTNCHFVLSMVLTFLNCNLLKIMQAKLWSSKYEITHFFVCFYFSANKLLVGLTFNIY